MHEIIVGNIGNVFFAPVNTGKAWRAATKTYNTYVDYSKSGYGRAAGEPVTWMQDGEIVKEHIGVGEMMENDYEDDDNYTEEDN